MKTTLNNSVRLLRDASIILLGATIYYIAITDMTKAKEIPECYMYTETIETAKDIQILLHEQAKLLHDLGISTAK